jgi:PAS domain S-box-containing protein
MWIWDLETLAFLAVNDAATQAYGYSRQEFLAMKVLDVRPPEDRQKFLEEIDPQHRIGHSTAEKWRHTKKDGDIFNVTVTSWALTFRGRRAELVLARGENIGLAPGRERTPLAGSISLLVPD